MHSFGESTPRHPLWRHGLIVGLVCLLVALVASLRPAFDQRLDESLRDFFLRQQASPKPEERLLVIDINEEDLRTLGPWPWPRGRIAELLEILLSDYGARAVALDIVFAEASTADPAGDARLASLLHHGPVVAAQILDPLIRAPALRQGVLAGAWPAASQKAGDPQPSAAPLAQGFIANHAGLAPARCAGNIGYQPDPDGVLRRIPLLTRYQGALYPHLALSLLNCANRSPTLTRLPSAGLWRLPMRRALSAYTVIPAAAVLHHTLDPQLIQGRYVLIGSSSLSLGDRISTPLAPLTAGVLAHAEALSGLLDFASGQQPAERSGLLWQLLWSVGTLLLAGWVILHASAWRSVLLLLGLALGWLALAAWASRAQLDMSLTAPLWGYLLLLLTAVPDAWRKAQQETRQITETLAHYVAQPVLNELLRRGIRHSLTPQRREVTVLIADLASYTRTTHDLPLETAAELTRSLLDRLTRPVLATGGTLDRYSGDGLVAFWGAPLDCPDQADQAVSAGLMMLAAIQDYNRQWTGAGHAPLRVRIGIESGMALVGDLGTAFRSTYTAVGDCINYASRLENAARELPADLIIGSQARARLLTHRTRSLGRITVRGTEQQIEVFSVDG